MLKKFEKSSFRDSVRQEKRGLLIFFKSLRLLLGGTALIVLLKNRKAVARWLERKFPIGPFRSRD